MRYRVDSPSTDLPTVSTVAIDATDTEVRASADYLLGVRHVRAWRPDRGEYRGFMPFVAFGLDPGVCRTNGGVHAGEDDAAYDAAVVEGEGLLQRVQAEFDRRMLLDGVSVTEADGEAD